MSGQWNSVTQQYEVFSTLEGGMVPTGSNRPWLNQSQGEDWPESCGYCKCSPCQCDGHGGSPGNQGVCGYCHEEIFDGECGCDGFGGDKETHEKACRYCSGLAVGNFCTECGMAQ